MRGSSFSCEIWKSGCILYGIYKVAKHVALWCVLIPLCITDDDSVSSKQGAARWISVLLSTEPVESVSSVQCIIKAVVWCAECISATVYWTRVQVYHLSSRVRGVYRSYCVSDQNPPPPQCQPAPVLAHTQGGRDLRWKAGETFGEEIQERGQKYFWEWQCLHWSRKYVPLWFVKSDGSAMRNKSELEWVENYMMIMAWWRLQEWGVEK